MPNLKAMSFIRRSENKRCWQAFCIFRWLKYSMGVNPVFFLNKQRKESSLNGDQKLKGTSINVFEIELK